MNTRKIGMGVGHLANFGAMTQTISMVNDETYRLVIILAHLIVAAVLPSFGGAVKEEKK